MREGGRALVSHFPCVCVRARVVRLRSRAPVPNRGCPRPACVCACAAACLLACVRAFARARADVRACGQGMVVTVEPGCYFVPALLEPAFAHPAQGPLLDEPRLRAMYCTTTHTHTPAPTHPRIRNTGHSATTGRGRRLLRPARALALHGFLSGSGYSGGGPGGEGGGVLWGVFLKYVCTFTRVCLPIHPSIHLIRPSIRPSIQSVTLYMCI